MLAQIFRKKIIFLIAVEEVFHKMKKSIFFLKHIWNLDQRRITALGKDDIPN